MALQNFISKRLPAISANWLNFIDLFGNSRLTGVDSGVINAYVVALPIGAGQSFNRATGAVVRFTTPNTNDGAATLNVAGTGVASVLGQDGSPSVGGEISSSEVNVVQWTGSAWKTVGTGATPDKVRTASETAAGVVPSNYAYAPADIRRYGALTSAANNSTAVQNAINSYVQGGPAVYIPSGTWNCTVAITGVTGLNIRGDGRLKSILQFNGGIKGFTHLPVALEDAALVLQDFSIRGTSAALQLIDLQNVTLVEFRDIGIRTTSLQCVRLSGECDSIKFYGGLIESWTTAGVEMAGPTNSLDLFLNTQFNVNNDIVTTGPAILASGGTEIIDLNGLNLNANNRPVALMSFTGSGSKISLRKCYAEATTASLVVASGAALLTELSVEDCNFSTTNSIRVDLNNGQAHSGLRLSGNRSPDIGNNFFHPGSATDFEYDGGVIDAGMTSVVGWANERYISYRATRLRGQGRCTVGPFTQENVAANQNAVPLSGTRWIAPRIGSAVGVVVKSTEARTADQCVVKVFKNTGLSGATGTDTGLSAILDATNTSAKATTQAPNLDTFNPGDELYCVVDTGAAWAPTTADIRVWIEVEL